MSMVTMVGDVIVQMFQTCVKDAQRDARPGAPNAMLVAFRTRVDHGVEQGYRYFDLLLYGPSNYVSVLARRRWCVIDQEHLEWNEDMEEEMVAEGRSYEEGEDPWTLLGCHDSGWRDAVQRFLRDHEADLLGFTGPAWYELRTLAEAEAEHLPTRI